MPVPFVDFGSSNENLYFNYLVACQVVALSRDAGAHGVFNGGRGESGALPVGLLGVESSTDGGVDRTVEGVVGRSESVASSSCGDGGQCGVGSDSCDSDARRVESSVDGVVAGSGECSSGVAGGGHEFRGVGGSVEGNVAANSSGDGVPVRGVNCERNRKKREKKKRRKLRAQGKVCISVSGDKVDGGSVPEWRRRSVEEVGSSKKGYFSDLSEETQRRLKETRAAAMIARNEREAALERSKLQEMSGLTGLVGQLNRLMRMSSRLESVSKNASIGGWAKTVCEAAQKSVSEGASVPDSISLESIGFGVGAAELQRGRDRKAEYERRKAQLAACYEAAPYYQPEDRESDERTLAMEFGDVLGDPSGPFRLALRKKCVAAMEDGEITADADGIMQFMSKELDM